MDTLNTNDIETSEIRLCPPFTNKLYSFLKEEFIYVNGKKDREEEKSIIHLDIKPLKNPVYHRQHIETFRKNYRSTTLSDSDKDLKTQLSYPVNDIELITNSEGIITRIQNLEKIQDKQKQQRTKHLKRITGTIAERFFSSLQNLYKNEKRLSKILNQYNYFGLLLFSFYKQDVRQIRNTSLMKNTLIHIEEQVTDRIVIPETKEVEVRIQGRIIKPVYI